MLMFSVFMFVFGVYVCYLGDAWLDERPIYREVVNINIMKNSVCL